MGVAARLLPAEAARPVGEAGLRRCRGDAGRLLRGGEPELSLTTREEACDASLMALGSGDAVRPEARTVVALAWVGGEALRVGVFRQAARKTTAGLPVVAAELACRLRADSLLGREVTACGGCCLAAARVAEEPPPPPLPPATASGAETWRLPLRGVAKRSGDPDACVPVPYCLRCCCEGCDCCDCCCDGCCGCLDDCCGDWCCDCPDDDEDVGVGDATAVPPVAPDAASMPLAMAVALAVPGAAAAAAAAAAPALTEQPVGTVTLAPLAPLVVPAVLLVAPAPLVPTLVLLPVELPVKPTGDEYIRVGSDCMRCTAAGDEAGSRLHCTYMPLWYDMRGCGVAHGQTACGVERWIGTWDSARRGSCSLRADMS